MHNVSLVLEDYLLVIGLSKSYGPLLEEIFKFINHEDTIIINASLKREVGKRINVTVGSIDNMLTKLVDLNTIIRLDRGMYKLCSELQTLSKSDFDEVVLEVKYIDKQRQISIKSGGQ